VGTLIPYSTLALFIQSAKNIYYIDSGWHTLTGPSGNAVFSTGSTNSIVSSTFWNGHILVTSDSYPVPMKVFLDSGSVFRVRNAGLPALASAPVVTAGAAGATNYIYAFTYTFTYTVGTVTFLDESAVTFVELLAAVAPDVTTVPITAIPVLSNSTTDNWDTANIFINIYRTVDAGDVFFYVGQVTNGTTTFNDTFADTVIQGNNITLYITDGTLDFQAPPKCKFMHMVNGVNFFGALFESGQELKNNFQQSFPNNPDATNVDFRDLCDEEIKGISSANNIPLVFCANSIYRLDGRYERDGSGGFTKQKISDTVGCVSNLSIVKTTQGTFFAGQDGFYVTDGLTVLNISTEFPLRYKDMVGNAPLRITGTFDSIQQRVLWAVAENGVENDTIYCLHLKMGISATSCFTTWEGSTNFAPTDLLFFNKALLRADTRGYVFTHSDIVFQDPLIDTSLAPSLWATKTIIYNYESTAFNFNTTMVRKWVTRMVINASNETKLSLGIQSINDAGRRTLNLKSLIFRDSVVWGEPDLTWGDPSITWGYDGIIEQSRLFPATGLRCSYKQVLFTNANVLIEDSEASGQAVTNAVTKVITLVAGNATWPTNCVNQFLSFSGDNYINQFQIIARTPTALTVFDTNNFLPTGTFDWEINGFPVGEVLNLLNYTLEFAYIGKTQTPYRPE
jgi:hypothetical protein